MKTLLLSLAALTILNLVGCNEGGMSTPSYVVADYDSGVPEATDDAGRYVYSPNDAGPQEFYLEEEDNIPRGGRLWVSPDSPEPDRCECFTYPVQQEGGLLCFVQFCTEECPAPGFAETGLCFRVRTEDRPSR